MCNQATADIIDQIIQDWIGQNRAFTAFEVSLEAKNRGSKERHRDMRGYIHNQKLLADEVGFGGYSKTLVNVGPNMEAYLYHPMSFDPTTYQPLDRNSGSSQPQNTPSVPSISATPPAAISSASSTPPDPNKDTYRFDNNDRLCVPTKILREAGFKAGDAIYVHPDANLNCVLLTKNAPQTSVSVIQRKVERNGDLRLSKTVIRSAQIDKSEFLIETDQQGNEKIVKVVSA